MKFDFKLCIYKEGAKFKEILVMPTGRLYHCDFLGLTNALIAALPEKMEGPVCIEGIYDVLFKFANSVGAVEDFLLGNSDPNMDKSQMKLSLLINKNILIANNCHFETPLKLGASGTQIEERLSYGMEFLFIKDSVSLWLAPHGKGRVGTQGRKTPSQRYAWYLDEYFHPLIADQSLSNAYKWLYGNSDMVSDEKERWAIIIGIYEAYQERSLQVSNQLTTVSSSKVIHKSGIGQFKHIREKSITSEFYTSFNGLLPLAWAEIGYAVRNNIFINTCTVCYRKFPITNGKYNHKYCSERCSAEAEKRVNKQNTNYNKIKALQMRCKRSNSQEEKDRLTKEIEALRSKHTKPASR
ncbi:MAG: hypothetical protein A4E55_01197 [Pelotomaculum sp. PtaU1.Bin035]|nr:MAG: hypothetical protein A4E55_01197 [Pelotomaculum sp. PtaU1.Bin035]